MAFELPRSSLAALALIGACTPFASSSSSDGGATGEQSAAPDEASYANLLTDDFESPSGVAAFWDTSARGEHLTPFATEGVDGSWGLVAHVPAGTTMPSMLRVALTSPRRARVSWKMKVLARGAGEIDFAGVRAADESASSLLVHVPSAAGFALQRKHAGRYENDTIDLSFQDWTPLSLAIDMRERTATLSSGERVLHEDRATDAWPTGNVFVELGASWVPPAGTEREWRVAFDDVRIAWD